MLDSKIDNQTIASTLMDIGLSDGDAQRIIQEVSSAQPAPQLQAPSMAQQQFGNVNLMKEEFETHAYTEALQDTAVHNILDMHGQKLDEVHAKLDAVKSAVSNMPAAAQDPTILSKLNELQSKIEEVGATANATKDLMEKILDVNRKMLTDLEARR
jgi:Zn-dependent oligopeptidase